MVQACGETCDTIQASPDFISPSISPQASQHQPGPPTPAAPPADAHDRCRPQPPRQPPRAHPHRRQRQHHPRHGSFLPSREGACGFASAEGFTKVASMAEQPSRARARGDAEGDWGRVLGPDQSVACSKGGRVCTGASCAAGGTAGAPVHFEGPSERGLLHGIRPQREARGDRVG